MTGPRQSLRSLQVFEAVYRHASVVGAASELNITPSAVSHQLKKLSEHMGEKLIERSGRSIVFTETGRSLAEELHAAFSQIELSVDRKSGRNSTNLNIAACSSFLTGCLVPRLSKIGNRNRSRQIMLSLYANELQVADAAADLIVATWPLGPSYWSHVLFEERLILVASARLRKPDLLLCPLITTDVEPGAVGREWTEYHRDQRLEGQDPGDRQFVLCTHYIVALEMAESGMGMAFIPDFLAAESIARGHIFQVNDIIRQTSRTYYLSIKENRRNDTDVLALANWFVAEFGRPHTRSV